MKPIGIVAVSAEGAGALLPHYLPGRGRGSSAPMLIRSLTAQFLARPLSEFDRPRRLAGGG